MIDTDAVKDRTDCREVVRSDMGEPIRHTGKAWQWWCPFHPDTSGTTPSLTAYPDGWKCFGCGEGGDVIDWLQKRRNLTFTDACTALGVTDQEAQKSLTASRPLSVRLPEPPSQEWQDSAIQVGLACCDTLWREAGSRALGWLRARGLSDDTIRDAWLGFQGATEWTYEGVEYARLFGLSVPRGITIPWQTGGHLWAVKVRRATGEPKYQQIKGGTAALYGGERLTGCEVAVICEGEFDALLLQQEAGDIAPAVTFGSASAREYDGWLPWLVHLRRVLVATDNDKSGDEAWEYWQKRTERARRLPPPSGAKDVTDAYLAGADLRAWVSAGLGE